MSIHDLLSNLANILLNLYDAICLLFDAILCYVYQSSILTLTDLFIDFDKKTFIPAIP
jgi:hypothetical protein